MDDHGAGPRPPFRVLLRMEIRPGTEREFESTWLDIGRRIAAEPANLGQTLIRDVEDTGVYWVITDWTDEPAFRAFETSAAHVDNRRRLQPYRTGGEMRLTRVVHRLRPAADVPAH
ncbi:antibiotic biosynthesis monooxygenase [Streptomyces sp. SKN60]|uniref:antibiotic biosynthesis monooxygenase family protein n=1 Tax=Streptomyces sp. SKN60 TaxID=2855506 RepID=UPI00224604E1|nr:antibiotic biosynthesis monooxygenase family protein [Streptomyces sp. SKN60]MCX2185384.1 antibiotic biosynthesis monooxygenase [Streptomyces sp. SKN60]